MVGEAGKVLLIAGVIVGEVNSLLVVGMVGLEIFGRLL